jgi:hypothetical protein
LTRELVIFAKAEKSANSQVLGSVRASIILEQSAYSAMNEDSCYTLLLLEMFIFYSRLVYLQEMRKI